jgi:hypothetical protein
MSSVFIDGNKSQNSLVKLLMLILLSLDISFLINAKLINKLGAQLANLTVCSILLDAFGIRFSV